MISNLSKLQRMEVFYSTLDAYDIDSLFYSITIWSTNEIKAQGDFNSGFIKSASTTLATQIAVKNYKEGYNDKNHWYEIEFDMFCADGDDIKVTITLT